MPQLVIIQSPNIPVTPGKTLVQVIAEAAEQERLQIEMLKKYMLEDAMSMQDARLAG